MRALDETPIDPEVAAALDAIDATLAGEPVDPCHAELAELALLLRAQRPEPSEAFGASLDQRVARRFAQPPAPTAAPAVRRRRLTLWGSAGALASAAVAGVVVAVVLTAGGSSNKPLLVGAPAPTAARAASARAAASIAAKTAPEAGAPSAPSHSAAGSFSTASSSSNGTVASSAASGALSLPPSVQPVPNGRKIIQGAQLALSTAPSRIDAVAQEVFDVIGQQNGIVSNSTVTATGGPGAYAEFQLSIPSANLAQTMAALSTLRYAHVASRTDTTQDVNDQYQSDVRALADARALRTSLLKQLANATTQAEIDSLTAQIHDAEASISSDQATLAQLNHQVDYSQVTLTINSAPLVPVPSSTGSGFTLGKAAHDAGRVLTVAAGVALIALAALLPLALLLALGWWIGAAIKRRRREQALDLV